MKLSDDELAFLTGSREPKTVRNQLWTDRLDLAVLSVGKSGSVVMTKNDTIEVPSVAVQAVDTTGAGDAFVSGLLAALHANPDLLEDRDAIFNAARFANAAGALTTTERGAIPALPDRDRVEALLAQAA